MATLNQRIGELEKLIAARTPVAPVQVIFLNIEHENPEEYAQKRRQIEAIEARGEKIVVLKVVDAEAEYGND